jgi:transcriptional regulator with GAF, ATPase, and Fis domain
VASKGPIETPPDFNANEAFLDALRDVGSLQRVPAGTRSSLSPVQSQLHALQADLVHALEIEGHVAGLVALGAKRNGTPFTAEDLTFLNALGQITNVALHSAKIHRQISRLNDDLQVKVATISSQNRQIAMLQAELSNLRNDERPARSSDSPPEFRREALKGNSPATLRVLDTVRKVAGSESSVLIRGESGTGKELLAQVIHDNSGRREGPMVAVHCASLSAGLLESELFGHVKGAFTGAHRDKVGRFEAANGGTLFLDEIGDISLETQIKLLRVLQERCFEPVGSTGTIQVDVRVITATHQNLEKLIAQGRFREDLYYRLNVISLTLPPLRDRIDDILELALHFLARANQRSGKRITHIEGDALAVMERHGWPGNVRELENVIERAVVLADGTSITLADLPVELLEGKQWIAPARKPRQTPVATLFGRDVESGPSAVEADKPEPPTGDLPERELLEEALRRCGGNKAEAARLLGLPRSTYFSKLKKYGIEAEAAEMGE